MISKLPRHCHELKGTGLDAAGNGPSLPVSSYGPAPRFGMAPGQMAFAPALSLARGFTVALHVEITAGSHGGAEGLAQVLIDDNRHCVEFNLNSDDGTPGTTTFQVGEVSYTALLPVGRTHFAATVDAEQFCRLYIGGISVASGTITLSTSLDDPGLRVTLGGAYLCGPANQLIVDDTAYNPADIRYLASGVGFCGMVVA